MLSGDDGTYVDFLKAGGHGVISVASHVIPREMIQWKKSVQDGKYDEANASLKKHLPLINHLFVEANPIPVKMALYFMGLIKSPELRLPLVQMSEDLAQKMKQEMKSLGVIK
jgi:4-hydroxy-tetrahydrodipicolinate synthase